MKAVHISRVTRGLLTAVRIPLLFALVVLVIAPYVRGAEQEMRFPAPEFKGGYGFPETSVPPATSQFQQWLDVALLFLALSAASWLAVKKHSRRGVFILMSACLVYFGFYKQGCICPIGSIQNVALSIFSPHYAVPASVLAFFILPLAFALFFGRVFCSSVCALGGIQDMVAIKPVNLPRKWTVGLSVIPYAYLGASVLLAATGTGFLICRFDPFIGFFRLSGNLPYLMLGGAFLVLGVFVARPYCRFFCPYGVLLGWMSSQSRHHLNITPTSCVNCRLCETSCPFDYIEKPNVGLAREDRRTGGRRLGILVGLTPVLILLCAWVGYRLAVPLSNYHNTVALAERLILEKQTPGLEPTLETRTFRSKGMPEEELFARAGRIRSNMKFGGGFFGGFVGLILGVKLIAFSTTRTRRDYEVDKTHCFSCARCCTYCPNDPSFKGNFVPGTPAYQQAVALEKPAVEQQNRLEPSTAGRDK